MIHRELPCLGCNLDHLYDLHLLGFGAMRPQLGARHCRDGYGVERPAGNKDHQDQ
jgi:hypothetical protein